MRTHRSSGLATIALALVLLLAACGQKGPLILPGADETGASPADGSAEQATRDEEEDN